jgi:pSer/pThr/pTyr-binding forkhead associated (FHA) protein
LAKCCRRVSYAVPRPSICPRENTIGLPLRDSERHTYAEYSTWPDELRYELIEGRAYAMAPAPSVSPQEVVGALHGQVAELANETAVGVLTSVRIDWGRVTRRLARTNSPAALETQTVLGVVPVFQRQRRPDAQ